VKNTVKIKMLHAVICLICITFSLIFGSAALAQRPPTDEYTTSERIYIYASLTYYNLSSTGLVWKAAVKIRDTYTDTNCTAADDDDCAKSHYMYIFPKTSTGQASFWAGDFTNFTMKEGNSAAYSYSLEKNFPPDEAGFISAFTTILSMSMTMARIVEEMGYSPTAIYIPKFKFVSNKGERLVPPAMDFTFQLLDPVVLDTDAAQAAYIEELRKQIADWKQKYADLQSSFNPGDCPDCNLETAALEAQVKLLEKQIADLTAAIGNKLKGSAQKARDAGISFADGTTSIGTAVNAVDALIAALTKAQNERKTAQDTIVERDKVIGSLNSQIASLNSQIAKLTADLAATGDNSALIAERDTALASLVIRTSERDAAVASLATANNTIATLTASLATANSTIATLNAQIAALSATSGIQAELNNYEAIVYEERITSGVSTGSILAYALLNTEIAVTDRGYTFKLLKVKFDRLGSNLCEFLISVTGPTGTFQKWSNDDPTIVIIDNYWEGTTEIIKFFYTAN